MRLRALGVASILLVVPIVMPSPAHADPVGGLSGWSNNHGLPYQISAGDLVGFWQSILYVDGFLNLCGGAGIDGYYGGNTSNATYSWQLNEGIGADGTVGPQTWGQANRWTFGTSTYFGINQQLPLSSGGAGLWFLNPVNGVWQTTDHYAISFAPC
ncbi:MAG: peptidoglycan-binding domain-containing protein [Acidimicrobiales bacterium]